MLERITKAENLEGGGQWVEWGGKLSEWRRLGKKGGGQIGIMILMVDPREGAEAFKCILTMNPARWVVVGRGGKEVKEDGWLRILSTWGYQSREVRGNGHLGGAVDGEFHAIMGNRGHWGTWPGAGEDNQTGPTQIWHRGGIGPDRETEDGWVRIASTGWDCGTESTMEDILEQGQRDNFFFL